MSDYLSIDPSGLARLEKIGGPAFVRKMIDLFLEEAPSRLAEARAAEKAMDYKAIGDAAHSLKSSAQNFGANNLSHVAEKIEMSARSNKIENLPAMLDELELAYSTARSWLESQRSMLPP